MSRQLLDKQYQGGIKSFSGILLWRRRGVESEVGTLNTRTRKLWVKVFLKTGFAKANVHLLSVRDCREKRRDCEVSLGVFHFFLVLGLL
jgi:hypothetical protein